MRRRVEEFDWAATPLGPRANWSSSLELSVGLVLASGFPMAVRWGPDLVLIYNDAYRDILGDKHPAALGHPLREVWPEIYDALGPLNEAILRGEQQAYFAEDQHWTLRRQSLYQEQAWFTTSYSPIPDPSTASGVGGVLLTTFETTKRVRNEQRLHQLTLGLEAEIEQRTRERDRIWNVSEDLLGVSDFAGYFTSINPAWTRLLGWTEAEIKSMHVSTLRHPDDADAAVAARARLAEGVPTVRIENRFRHKDGTWRTIAWTLTADAGLIYVIGRHVTAEKQTAEALRASERQFRLLVAGVVDYAIFMLDPNGIVSSWNSGAERIKGYTADEIIGHHFSRFYTERARAAGVPARSLNTALQEGRFEAEGWRMRKNGSLFWASVVIDAIKDERGQLIGFAKITRDITERREAQAALERAQAERAQLQKMEAIGQLTGGVAHDFNNLLMIVSGHIPMIKNAVAQDRKATRAVEAIEIAARRGESLTRQLLTFSRRQTFNPTVVEIGKCIDAIRPVLMSSIGSTVELTNTHAPDVWPVKVDISEFELALVNLTLNARDALSQGGGVISISSKNVRLRADDTPERLEGEFVALTVYDTGSGIPPDIMPKVFDPFFTTKEVNKGTGLGLSQVHGFAHQSGGTVTIKSELGSGTSVTLYLPRAHSTIDKSESASAIDDPGGGKVLLVEDNPEVAEVTRGMLKRLGYAVHTANDAPTALKLLDLHAFDLLVSDIVMAGPVDGLGLARMIRKRDPDLAIILVTGYADSAARATTQFTVLRKPYQLEELSRATVRALAEARQTRATNTARLQPPG
jgi:PAS domain S-box-containing protein